MSQREAIHALSTDFLAITAVEQSLAMSRAGALRFGQQSQVMKAMHKVFGCPQTHA
jgi:hypothetical protein